MIPVHILLIVGFKNLQKDNLGSKDSSSASLLYYKQD